MAQAESRNDFYAKGLSGEKGKTQLMPGRFEQLSRETLGYVPPFTEVNEEYVVTKIIELWQSQGLTARDISLKWNQGHVGPCSSGVNSKGVAYDSCAYAIAVTNNYSSR